MNEISSEQQAMHVKGVIETLLFVNEQPITLDQFKKVLGSVKPADIKRALVELQNEYEQRKSGMMILEIAGGFQMLTNKSYASYVREFYKTKHKQKLSKPSLETLAIIAYKQPVTRADVESIRGMNADGVVSNLLDKELIKITGRKDVPGKPYLYGTTKQFLEYFGLKSLEDLPKLEDFSTLQPDYEKGETEGVEDDPEADVQSEQTEKESDANVSDQNEEIQGQSEVQTEEDQSNEESQDEKVSEEISESK